MKIALAERFPLLQTRLDQMFSQKMNPPEILKARPDGEYDLVLSDLNYLSPALFRRAAVCLFPQGAVVTRAPCGLLLCGGMGLSCPVTLSSISEDFAMLCLQQEVILLQKSIVPFEKRIPFDRSISLYKNLALGFAAALAQQLSGEEG